MAIQTIEYLKSRFESGDFPDANDFQDLIDSCYNMSEADLETIIYTLLSFYRFDSTNVNYNNLNTIIDSADVQGAITQLAFMVNRLNNSVFPSPTPTPSVTPTVTSSVTPTLTPSITPTVTSSVTPTVTPTVTETPSVTVTPTVTETPSVTVTPTVTPTVTETPSVTPTVTVTPTITVTSSVTPTVTPSPTPAPFSVLWRNFNNLPSYTYTGNVNFNSTATELLVRPKSGLLTFDGSYQTEFGDVNVADFLNLTILNLKNCGLGTLAVSGCSSLKELNCSTNNLFELDLRTCTSLIELDASGNQLNTALLSGVNTLRTVILEGNDITSLNITGNSNLSSINVGYCNFSDLDTLFTQLPDRTSLTQGYIAAYHNPGTGSCITSIATDKNWSVNLITPLRSQVLG